MAYVPMNRAQALIICTRPQDYAPRVREAARYLLDKRERQRRWGKPPAQIVGGLDAAGGQAEAEGEISERGGLVFASVRAARPRTGLNKRPRRSRRSAGVIGNQKGEECPRYRRASHSRTAQFCTCGLQRNGHLQVPSSDAIPKLEG